MSSKQRLLFKPFTLIISILYLATFLFTLTATNAGSTFIHIIKDNFTHTSTVLTFGEQLMDFVAWASPLLLAVSFACIYLLGNKAPRITSALFLISSLVTISGITVFVCLNTYTIIDTFSNLSKLTEYAQDSSRTFYEQILTSLIPYHILLVFYAGSLANFSLNVKKDLLGASPSKASALSFATANALLAVWHIITLLTPMQYIDNYFTTQFVDKSGFIFTELSAAVCFAAVAVFAFIYSRQNQPENK